MMLKDGTVEDSISNLDSIVWKGAHLFFQANQMGILDPDIYINKWETMSAKGDRVLTSQACGDYSEFNTLNAEKGQGYAVIPMKAREYVIAAATPLGGAHRMFIIPSEGKEPEAVPASVTQVKKEDPNWNNTVGANKYVPGLGLNYVDPKYNQPVGLTRPEDLEAPPALNPFQKLYCDRYGISSMRDAYAGHLDVWTTDGTVTALLEAAPDDIAEIDAQINKYLGVEIPNIISAEDQGAFEAKQQEIIEECKKMGLDQSVAFWKDNYIQAAQKAAKYK